MVAVTTMVDNMMTLYHQHQHECHCQHYHPHHPLHRHPYDHHHHRALAFHHSFAVMDTFIFCVVAVSSCEPLSSFLASADCLSAYANERGYAYNDYALCLTCSGIPLRHCNPLVKIPFCCVALSSIDKCSFLQRALRLL